MIDKSPIGNTQFPEDCDGTQGNLPVEAGNCSVIHTCDICPKVIFESEKALERHIEIRHKSLMEGINFLLGKEHSDFTIELSDEKRAALGAKAFDVAKKRDAGHGMLECASIARQQLQRIVDVWHPGAEVFIFGSSLVMSSWDGKSDIDFAVVDPHAYVQRKWPPEEKNAVRELTDLCKSAGFKVSSLECVDTARVPIVKHKTLQDSLLNTVANTKPAEKARRSICLTYRSEKVKTTEALRAWLEKETETATIEEIIDEGQCNATVTFTTSTNAMVAMIKVNNGQKRRLNEYFSARIMDERFPPEAHCIDFDLCLRQFGIRNSEYLRKLHTLYDNSPFLRSGAVVLKEWSKLWGLNNSFMGFLTSYAINIMWIFFLVKRDVIPYASPYDTPENPREALREPTYVPILPQSAGSSEVQIKMGSLLADFFKFYATEFDWEKNVVSLNRPGITTKKS
ncbi:RNA editing 3' terminal uridylyl transferase, partial [Perkinsela sp. CCAP 1560/4]